MGFEEHMANSKSTSESTSGSNPPFIFEDAEYGAAGAAVQYGTLGDTRTTLLAKELLRRQRTTIEVVTICCYLILPVLIFASTYFVMSYDLHYWSTDVAYTCAFLLLLVSLTFGWLSFEGKRHSEWQSLVCALCVIAWTWAEHYGDYGFQTYMQPYWDLQQLNVYKDVDPSTAMGTSYMDFAILGFAPNVSIDQNLSVAFKNGVTYCAAPMTLSSTVNGTDLNGTANSTGNDTGTAQIPTHYDFWAVGTDCCRQDFQCAHPNATTGLRVVRNEERQFFNLAVQKAVATHNIQVINPLFFRLVADPPQDMKYLLDQSAGAFWDHLVHFMCVEAVFVGLAVVFGLWPIRLFKD